MLPDGRQLREYGYTRVWADDIFQHLRYRGYDVELLVPETMDVSLKQRVKRVNQHCKALGKDNVILVSLHINAAGSDGKWHLGRGWSCYTTKGETGADDLATCLCKAAEKYLPGHKMRFDYADGDPDQEENFYLLRKTRCPAVLTESLFQDNMDDCLFLMSDEGRKAIVSLHVEGIVNYLKFTENQ